jgi:acyl-CoA thioesterase
MLLHAVGDGVYTRDVDDTWWGWNGQFGGYSLALALHACRMQNNDSTQRERAITMHFLRRMPAGSVRVVVATERQGRTATTFSVRLSVDERLCGVGLVMFGSDRRAEAYQLAQPPDLVAPPPNETPQGTVIPGKFLEQLDVWPRHRGDFTGGSDVAESGGWLRLADRGGADERFLMMVADAYMPLSFLRASEPAVGGTLDFTAHFRAPVPETVIDGSEPVRVHLTSARSLDGYVDEDATVWTANGQLLLQSRQMRYTEIVDDLDVLNDIRGGG